jgi:hypothetical protein
VRQIAFEILENRKLAGLFGSSTDLTQYGHVQRFGLPKPDPMPASGFNMGARTSPPQAFPANVMAAKNKSLAQTKSIQDIMARVQGPAPAAPEPSPAERLQRHTTTIDTLKAVEASRTRPKLPVPPKTAQCLALAVLSGRTVA